MENSAQIYLSSARSFHFNINANAAIVTETITVTHGAIIYARFMTSSHLSTKINDTVCFYYNKCPVNYTDSLGVFWVQAN